MDAKSLYTSIPHEDGLIALRHFLDQRPDPDPPLDALIRLAELVLQFFFSFVAMGSNLGRSFACLFVKKNISKLSRPYTSTFQGPRGGGGAVLINLGRGACPSV